MLALAGIGVAGVRWANSRSQHRPQEIQSLRATSLGVSAALAMQSAPQIQVRQHRLVYPYSVVPGGVASAQELENATAHDPVVATHYSGFNYHRARIQEVRTPLPVYLSYRLGNRIYWTRKTAMLRVGEKVLTDGNIAARTRCGNQVSVLPQANTSPNEPSMAELDRPDAVASGAEALPSELSASLLHFDPVMPLGPAMPGGGISAGPPGAYVPPPLAGGGGTQGGSPGGGGGGGGNPPPTVPEPATIVLVLSGAAVIATRYRMR